MPSWIPTAALALGAACSSARNDRVEQASTPKVGSAAAGKCDPAVTAKDIEACVRYLASDELQGRFTGSPGGLKAAEFLQAGLERAGVKPAGDDGTYFQRVPLQLTTYSSVPELHARTADGTESAGVYGIDFEQLRGMPEPKSLNVKLVAKAEDVPHQPDAGTALVMNTPTSTNAREWLKDAGAPQGRGFGLIVYCGNDQPGISPINAVAGPSRQVVADPAQLPVPTMRVRGALLQRLRKGEIATLDVRVQGKREMLPAFNVVGKIAGVGSSSAPELAKQAIVISAHYDHLDLAARKSTDPATPEDIINNGADDDASGCSAVLELAEAFGAGPAPARTLIFFFATGEEIGLLGTDWYIEHPAVPLADTVCNLNFEMIGRPDPLAGGAGKMWLTGYELSNLGPEFAKAGLAVVLDPRPDQHFFSRSDNIAFVNRGIVGQTLSTFNLHTDYHHVSDEADKCDYPHMEGCVKAGLECARLLASGAVTPVWNPGMQPKHQ